MASTEGRWIAIENRYIYNAPNEPTAARTAADDNNAHSFDLTPINQANKKRSDKWEHMIDAEQENYT